jgi:hypothetical protein
VHVTFNTQQEAELLEECGFMTRIGMQFHWWVSFACSNLRTHLLKWIPICACALVELARTIHIRCMHGISGREIISYTIIYTFLANPTHLLRLPFERKERLFVQTKSKLSIIYLNSENGIEVNFSLPYHLPGFHSSFWLYAKCTHSFKCPLISLPHLCRKPIISGQGQDYIYTVQHAVPLAGNLPSI